MTPNRGWFESFLDGAGSEGHKITAAEKELIALSATLKKQIEGIDVNDEKKHAILTALQTQLGEIAENHQEGLEKTPWLRLWGTLATIVVGGGGLALSTQDVESFNDIVNRLALTAGGTALVATLFAIVIVIHQVKNSRTALSQAAALRTQAEKLT